MKANIQKKEFLKKFLVMEGEYVDFIEACVRDANDDILQRVLGKYEKEVEMHMDPLYKLTIDDLKNITNVFRKRNFSFRRHRIKAILVRLLVAEIVAQDLENIMYYDDDFNISTLIEKGVLYGEIYYEDDTPVYLPIYERNPKVGYKTWSTMLNPANYSIEQIKSMFSEEKLISLNCNVEKKNTTLAIFTLISVASIMSMYHRYDVKESGIGIKSFIERVLSSEAFENILSHLVLTEYVTEVLHSIYDNFDNMIDILYEEDMTYNQTTRICLSYPEMNLVTFEDYVDMIRHVFSI